MKNIINFPVVGNIALKTSIKIKRSKKVEGSGRKAGTQGKAEPIRDLESLKKMRNFFLEKCNETNNDRMKLISARNYTLFLVGLNTALRISDIFKLTFEELLKAKYYIKEKKTGKYNNRYKSCDIEQAVKFYIKTLDNLLVKYKLTDKCFIKFNFNEDTGSISFDEPMTTQNFIKILKNAAEKCGIKDNIGTHTMRKTFSYWFLMNNRNDSRALTLLCSILNHSNERITLAYAGISDDEFKTMFEDMGNFYLNVDKGESVIYNDKIAVSRKKIEELLQYAYTSGKEHTETNLETDIDNLKAINDLLEESILY